MIDLKGVTVEKTKEAGAYGRFVIEPLPAGYGLTLGNALRRVLYASLPGAAIAEVSFAGVSHPFTTIKGVKEDVVELILNLKKVRFVAHIDGPAEARIEAKGKGVVTAGDIQVGAGLEVANPELRVATLTDKSAKLSAKLLIEKGVGYKMADEREGSQVGVIPVDSVFTPVVKVAYRVEETRRGGETNLDRLIMEITTDGTIKPSKALQEAAEILIDCFTLFTAKKGAQKTSSSEPVGPSQEIRKLSLSKLNLTPQTLTALTGARIKTVGGLLKKSKADLLAIKGFGGRRLMEVTGELKRLGVALKEDPSEGPPASSSAEAGSKVGRRKG